MKKIYIAGKLCSEEERALLEGVDKFCKAEGFDTFLPHRDVGVIAFKEEIKRAFKEDVKALDECDFVLAVLNGKPGSGTVWEIGYAYSIKKPIIGLKTDKKVEDSIPELSAMVLGSVKILQSFEELKEELFNLKG
ncbi:MAG: nucleoside 2-deoxyribosyltransferase [archaeon]